MHEKTSNRLSAIFLDKHEFKGLKSSKIWVESMIKFVGIFLICQKVRINEIRSATKLTSQNAMKLV